MNVWGMLGTFLILGAVSLVPAFGDTWIDPTKETIDTASGTLEYDKVPQDFVCDVTPRVQHNFVSKNNPVTYPKYDSLILRISGKNSFMDMQLEASLWKGNVTSATDLSYDVSIRSMNGTRLVGGIYSPDAVSKYSTLGVVMEASDNFENGILSSDDITRMTELFGSKYVSPMAFPHGVNDFEVYVMVFDSDDDWIDSDRCGVKVVIPVSVDNNYTVDVGTMKFSNVKVSALESKHPIFEVPEQNDTVAKDTNQTVIVHDSAEDTNSEFDGGDIISSQGIFGPPVIELPKLPSPLKQFEITMRPSLEKFSFKYGEPFEYTLETKVTGPNQYYVGEHVKTRFINKAAGTASEWSDVTLENRETHVVTSITGHPFDKKGTYMLQTLYNPPRLFAYSDIDFELLNDADPNTLQGKAHILSPFEQVNAQIPFRETKCKDGLQPVLKYRTTVPACLKPDTKEKLVESGWAIEIKEISEEEATALVKKQYPELSDFPSDNLPPRIIQSQQINGEWYLAFVTQGSGVDKVIDAKCFFVGLAQKVSHIGDYENRGDSKENFSIMSCSTY